MLHLCQIVLNSLQVLFHFHNPTCAYNHHHNFHQKFSSASLFRPYLFIKSFLQSPLTLPSSIPPRFCIQQSLQSTSKVIYPSRPFSQFRLQQGTNEKGSLVRTDTVLISVFFLKVQTGMTGLRITDSLAQAPKTGVLQVVVSDEDACNQNGKPSNSPSLIPLTYWHYFHTVLIPPQELTYLYKSVAQLDFHCLAFSYTIHPPPPTCFEVLLSYHSNWSSIKLVSKTVPSDFGIRPQRQHKDKDLRPKYLAVVIKVR